jgi:hypothetical protein
MHESARPQTHTLIIKFAPLFSSVCHHHQCTMIAHTSTNCLHTLPTHKAVCMPSVHKDAYTGVASQPQGRAVGAMDRWSDVCEATTCNEDIITAPRNQHVHCQAGSITNHPHALTLNQTFIHSTDPLSRLPARTLTPVNHPSRRLGYERPWWARSQNTCQRAGRVPSTCVLHTFAVPILFHAHSSRVMTREVGLISLVSGYRGRVGGWVGGWEQYAKPFDKLTERRSTLRNAL